LSFIFPFSPIFFFPFYHFNATQSDTRRGNALCQTLVFFPFFFLLPFAISNDTQRGARRSNTPVFTFIFHFIF